MLNSCTYQYPQFWVSEKQDFPLPRTQSTTLIVFCNIFVLDCCSWSQPFLVLVIRIQSPSWMSHMLRLPSSHYIVQAAKAPQQIPLHFEYRELNTSLNPPEKGWKSFFLWSPRGFDEYSNKPVLQQQGESEAQKYSFRIYSLRARAQTDLGNLSAW